MAQQPTTLEDLDNPTEERFAAYVSLWMNEEKTAPNWVFTLKQQVRRVKHEGAVVQFIMKNGAVYTAVVAKTTEPADPTVMGYEVTNEDIDEEDESWLT